jgi:hypothetical protein
VTDPRTASGDPRLRILLPLLPLGRTLAFWCNHEVRRLRDPDGEPTGRQLLALNRLGALAPVQPGQVAPLTKAQAAWLIDALKGETP